MKNYTSLSLSLSLSRLLRVCAAFALISLPAHASCSTRRCVFDWGVSPYISASAGWGGTHHASSTWDHRLADSHSGMVFSGAVGLEFDIDRSFNLRTEFEFIHDTSSAGAFFNSFVGNIESQKLTTQLYMVNMFIDFASNWRISPYLGIGAGSANMVFEQTWPGWDFVARHRASMAIAWGLYAGLGIDITRHLTADIGGRIVGFSTDISDANFFGQLPAINFYLISGRAGLRYTF